MFDKVMSILAEYIDTNAVTEASMLDADLGLSSFDLVSIVGDFEDTFGIEIPDRDIPKFICIRDIVEYLESHT